MAKYKLSKKLHSSSWLTTNGWIAAFICGLIWYWCMPTVLLLFPFSFLILGSMASRIHPKEWRDTDAQGRDAKQVLANAGVSLVCSIAFYWTQNELFIMAFVLSFSIALSDTFSSEFGRFYRGATIDVARWKKVPVGLSGGISWQGTMAGFVGAGIIGLMCLLLLEEDDWIWPIISFGFIGMLVDSVLGSVFQKKYMLRDGLSDYGREEEYFSGVLWVDNNMVNLLSIALTTLSLLIYMTL